jgi:hypothetical protein
VDKQQHAQWFVVIPLLNVGPVITFQVAHFGFLPNVR